MSFARYRPGLQLFLDRLTTRSHLEDEERDAILALPAEPIQVRAHQDFVALGEFVEYACLLANGFVARFDQVADGKRQIIAVHLPGEMPDLYSLMLPRAPSALQATTPAMILRVPHAALRQIAFRFPGVSAALWRECVVDGGIIAQWLVNVGRRDARSRMAHFLCEMALRHWAIGQLRENVFPLPMTQEQLADALGLTNVHINRTLKALRDETLVRVGRGIVEVLDWGSLLAAADFDPTYLHLGGRKPNFLGLVRAPSHER